MNKWIITMNTRVLQVVLSVLVILIPSLSETATAQQNSNVLILDWTEYLRIPSNACEEKEFSLIYNSGSTTEMLALGAANAVGCLWFGKDERTAWGFFNKAAKLGNSDAQNNLAIMYEFGRGTDRNESLALLELQKSAKSSNAWALANLGRYYELGISVGADKGKALELYQKAIATGNYPNWLKQKVNLSNDSNQNNITTLQTELSSCPLDQTQVYHECFGRRIGDLGGLKYDYVGEWYNDQKNGRGTETFEGGSKYVGEFKNNAANGQGIYNVPNYWKYTGTFKDYQRNGLGQLDFANGDKYVGAFKNDMFNGQGTFTFASGDRYTGEFRDYSQNGSFVVNYSNGDSFTGEYQSDKRNGQGTYIWKNGSRYIGQWKDGLPTSDGILTDASGAIIVGAQYLSAAVYKDGGMTSPDILTYSGGSAQQVAQQTPPEQQQTGQAQTPEPQRQEQQPVAANDNTRRLALVVGIDSYQKVAQLKKAVNDSRAVSTALQKIGYDVVTVENPDRRTMSSKLQEFQGKIQPGDTAFFFFAGHGVALGPDNILLAADVPKLEPGQDDIAKDEGFSVDNIIRRFQKQGAKTAMLVLDACRNNPFETDGTRSVGNTRGLAKQDAPEGVFVLFSAGLGQEALDRLSDDDPDPNSVFTRKLVPALMTPSITHNDLAKRVQKDVSELAATINVKQQPAYYDQIVGEIPMNSLDNNDDAVETHKNGRGLYILYATNDGGYASDTGEFVEALKQEFLRSDRTVSKSFLELSRNLEKSNSQLKQTAVQYNALTDDVILAKGSGDTEAVAIVIANDKYENIESLTGAVRDGSAVAESFEKLGFKVITSYNKSKSELLSELNDLKSQLDKKTGILVVYYAGHAVEIDGSGYILASDAPFPDSEQEIMNESIKFDEMIEVASREKFATVVILDANRDNPFRTSR